MLWLHHYRKYILTSNNMGTDNHDCDLRHHIRTTIILLGGDMKVADLLEKSNDAEVTEEDVLTVKRYNMNLIDSLKTRLVSIPKMTLRVVDPGETY